MCAITMVFNSSFHIEVTTADEMEEKKKEKDCEEEEVNNSR